MNLKKLSATRKTKARCIGSWPRAMPASEKLTAVTSLKVSLASAIVLNSPKENCR
jgi:hypothetical protein